jgi:hypothetical protein
MIFRLLIYSCLQLLNLHGYGEYLWLLKRWLLILAYFRHLRQLINDRLLIDRALLSESILNQLLRLVMRFNVDISIYDLRRLSLLG